MHLIKELKDFAAADLTRLTRVVKRKLKTIQYRAPSDGRLSPAHWPDNGPQRDQSTGAIDPNMIGRALAHRNTEPAPLNEVAVTG
ncbi:hypothetical protein ACF1HJ_06115 [Streptomyces sp. NPDC013978]|uniref:hypothetical protein n=1 Tax=Streptomyces sp. NPDC013978 TaxID=3364869 RepID=UPI003700858A